MKRYLVLSIVLLSVILGCTAIAPEAPNEPPVAYINSVSETTSIKSNPVTFNGHGTDADGTVVAYLWRSSIDGILSNAADFTTTTLSVGKHSVYFKVQDNRGDWSKEVFVFLNVIPAEASRPLINLFQVNPDYISPGESTSLTWDVSYATDLSIGPDIGNVALTGSRTIYPQKNTTYILTATNSNGQAKAETKVYILEKQAKTVELYSIPGEDGTVRRDTIIEFDPMVGQNSAGTPMQAFLSFDISMIPSNAIIKDVSLDISNSALYGYPFSFLGAMGIFRHQYGTLESKDYIVGFPRESLYTTYTRPTQAYKTNLLNEAVQSQITKGADRFQVRLQFEKFYYGGQENYMILYSNNVKLTITYE